MGDLGGPESAASGDPSLDEAAGSRSLGAVASEGVRERGFEELQRELEDVVARLERGDIAVDDAIALFKRGEELYRESVERLHQAELRIEELAPPDQAG
jgi:exodeoxyribonuclease VII small subunit